MKDNQTASASKGRSTFQMRLKDEDERRLEALDKLYDGIPDRSTLMRAIWDHIIKERPTLVLNQEFSPN